LAWLEEVDPHQPKNLPYFTGKSGTHRENGILLAHGTGVRAGVEVAGARIIDLAPTILHLLGVPVPAEMDGRILHELLTDTAAASAPGAPSFLAAFPQPQLGNGVAHADDATGYSLEDEETVAERLKALGYVE
jgi:hypothetical protein